MAILDLTTAQKAGNFTGGSYGLEGPFNSNLHDNSYSTGVYGWIAVRLPSPARIKAVRVRSGGIGFDSSFATDSATVRAFQKSTPGVPAGVSGALQIGSKSIAGSTDYEHANFEGINLPGVAHWVLVDVTSYVWCSLSNIEIETYDGAIVLPDPLPPHHDAEDTIYQFHFDSENPLPDAMARLPNGTLPDLEIKSRVVADVHLYADTKHDTEEPYYGQPIGVALRLGYQVAATREGLATAPEYEWPRTTATGQLRDRQQHYQPIGCPVAMELNPAWYRIHLRGTGHTSAAGIAGVDGIAKLLVESIGRNTLMMTLKPNALLYSMSL